MADTFANATGTDSVPIQLFIGGVPNSDDWAPSIIFLICYVAILAKVSYNIFVKGGLPMILMLWVLLHILSTIAALVLRLVMIRNPTFWLQIGEQMMLSILPILLAASLTSVIPRHAAAMLKSGNHFERVARWFMPVIHLAWVACLCLNAYYYANQTPAGVNRDQYTQVMRQWASDFTLGVVCFIIVVIIGLWTQGSNAAKKGDASLSLRRLFIDSLFALLLFIACTLRAIQSGTRDPMDGSNSKPVFWILIIAPQMVCTSFFALFDWAKLMQKDVDDDLDGRVSLEKTPSAPPASTHVVQRIASPASASLKLKSHDLASPASTSTLPRYSSVASQSGSSVA